MNMPDNMLIPAELSTKNAAATPKVLMDLQELRFAFDAELNVKLATLPGLRVYEVGISYYGRTFTEGKKIRFRDALRAVYCIIKYSLTARQAPQPISIDSSGK